MFWQYFFTFNCEFDRTELLFPGLCKDSFVILLKSDINFSVSCGSGMILTYVKNRGDSPEKERLDRQNPELRVCSLEAHSGYSWFLFLTVFG